MFAMKQFVRIVTTALALLACIAALGTFVTLLYDFATGVTGNVGRLGAWVVGALLLGQCRILWLLVSARTIVRARQPRVRLPGSATP